MKVEVNVVERKSAKTGKTYVCLEIPFTPRYTKTVFLDSAEVALLDMIEKGGA